MASLSTVTIFSILFCVQGVFSQTGGTGQECRDTSPPCTQSTDTCQSKTCKLKVGSNCLGPLSTLCVLGSRCINETCGACVSPFFVVDTNLCVAAPTYVGGDCSGTGQGTCKDSNAECFSRKCRCKSGYVGDLANNSCTTASAAGVTLSMTLLMAALLVTSHFL